MPFDQKRFDRSVTQTRMIFDKFIYRPQNNDTIAEMQQAGYFNASRFADDPDWVGSLVEIDIPTGYFIGKILSNGAVTVLIDSTKAGGSTPTEVLFTRSTNTQAPGSLNSPIQVEFGPGAGTPGDPVMVDAAGTITINQSGAYNFRATFNIQRAGSTGEAFPFFRVLLNNQQVRNPIAHQFDDGEEGIPDQFNFFNNFSANDTLKVEFYRDGQGTPAANEGSLVSFTSQIGWGQTSSASLSVTRF